MKKSNYYYSTSEITKEHLQKLGVEYVSPDGTTVIYKGKELKFFPTKSGKRRKYLNIKLYDPEFRQTIPKEERKSSTGQFNLGVHVLNYIWQTNSTTRGLDVHHIDNNPFNNDISNLELKTRKENLEADRKTPPRRVPMPKYVDEAELRRRIEGYEMAYEQAKADHDAKAAHKLRCNLSVNRSILMQYLENPEQYIKPVEPERACHARADKRKELQANVDSARKYYKEFRAAYGKDDPIVKKYWGEWKLAIAYLNEFNEKSKQAS